MESKTYRILVLGPAFVGKTSFCKCVKYGNCISNNSLDYSYTKNPFSYIFKRDDTNLEFIDTPGYYDNSEYNKNYLNDLINYLKPKKEIDHIILLFKFRERITKEIKNYLSILSKLFTPNEFFCHLTIIFTGPPLHPTKKDNEHKELYIKEIKIILRNCFNLSIEKILPKIQIYFINTVFGEDEDNNEHYDKKFQDTIDIIIKFIKLNSEMYKPINTENFELNGVDKRISQEKEKIETIKKKLEEENLIIKKEMKKKNEAKKKLEEENLIIKKEMENLEEMKKKNEAKKKLLEEKQKVIDAERKKLEEEENKRKRNILLIGGTILSTVFSPLAPVLLGGWLLKNKFS